MVFILNVFLLLLLRDLSLSLIVWAVLIMRTYNLPLAVLQLFLGYCLARIDATPLLIIRAIFSSFFYLASIYGYPVIYYANGSNLDPLVGDKSIGNSNNFSTVDIAVGFAGVETYQPIQIAVQIILSTYSGPLLIVFGWWQYLVEESVTSISLLHKRNSLLCWISSVLQLNVSLCLLSLYIQRYHLFVCIKDYPLCDILGFLQSNDKVCCNILGFFHNIKFATFSIIVI
ncbi:unnamed protein product [Brugia pahangi]|uniref:Uncharacterized protein n=1 Tax=Brugia pahangi TaxID=6280 RepID=A0A0N4T6Z7_BRUPA|nr:unnamed protein product [Brugia pahangi]